MTAVPGLHFDEAWQGLYAHRIAAEPGFWPLTAMNHYTSPMVHYILAIAFNFFGPSLLTMRGTYGFMHLVTLILMARLLWLRHKPASAAWFLLFWGLSPLSVHLHRFYVEMNGFFGLCFALMLWALHHWQTKPKSSALLFSLAFLAGVYSHVLFAATGVGLAAALFCRPSAWAKPYVKITVALIIVACLPQSYRIFDTIKFSVTALILFLSAGCIFWCSTKRLRSLSHFIQRTYHWAFWGSLPFLIGYVLLFWSGVFSYGQVAGLWLWFLFPINSLLFLFIAWRAHQRLRVGHDTSDSSFLWKAFVFSFLASSFIIFKQSPRYYMVPTLLFLGLCALEFARLKSLPLKASVILVFAAWNLYTFNAHYITPFQQNGATEQEFKLWFYRDSAKDFRPYQKVFAWLETQGCGRTLRGVENDRFLRPIQFLQLTASHRRDCPWIQDELIFRTVPQKTEDYPNNLKLLVNHGDWGDLGLWVLKH